MTAGLVAAIAVGAGSLLWGDRTAPPVAPAVLPGHLVAAAEWEDAATVSLASVRRQIGVAHTTLARWDALPADRRGAEPTQVGDLRSTADALERAQASLISGLSAWQNLHRTHAALDQAEQNRAALVTSAPQSPESPPATPQLDDLDQQIARLRQQTALWSTGVDVAARVPVPGPEDTTSALSASLTELIDHRGT